MFDDFGNSGRSFGSIRELAEAMRQDVWTENRRQREEALREEEAVPRGGGMERGEEAAYHRPPLGGNFINKTRKAVIFIVGESGPGRLAEVREVQPGNRDAPYFDADFFKCNGTWYKIPGGGTASVVVENGKMVPRGHEREADPDETRDNERLLRSYIENKKGRGKGVGLFEDYSEDRFDY